VDDRRPKKHAAAFVGRLRPPIALAASPALFARQLYIGATLGSRPKVCRQWARCSVQGGVYQRPGHALSGGRGPRSRRYQRAAL